MKQHTPLTLAAVAALLAGCVTVKAPDKPIEINLNVNIRQEVVYSLKQDANDLIKDNPELFPK
ncbi:MAG: YnbE family lipoprotein [Sphingomonadales bacterium]|nr:YnbE family lipoprotein [Sphingomonadales bacterium]MBP7136744.1 YnbE family lipoprotein [Sphingomonadaceae bacterium]MBK6720009.1 YnbE family lipoprotein [Sphingomonadales bacterium]MBK8271570.1 YnbE family lipoprotein [Sphingomonadales bacterium]MBK8861550.1 YnbE family lipoprotein [Sphingomonadales bacterium]